MHLQHCQVRVLTDFPHSLIQMCTKKGLFSGGSNPLPLGHEPSASVITRPRLLVFNLFIWNLEFYLKCWKLFPHRIRSVFNPPKKIFPFSEVKNTPPGLLTQKSRRSTIGFCFVLTKRRICKLLFTENKFKDMVYRLNSNMY